MLFGIRWLLDLVSLRALLSLTPMSCDWLAEQRRRGNRWECRV